MVEASRERDKVAAAAVAKGKKEGAAKRAAEICFSSDKEKSDKMDHAGGREKRALDQELDKHYGNTDRISDGDNSWREGNEVAARHPDQRGGRRSKALARHDMTVDRGVVRGEDTVG